MVTSEIEDTIKAEKNLESNAWTPERENAEQWADEMSRKEFEKKFDNACINGGMDKLFYEVLNNMSSYEVQELMVDLVAKENS